MRDKKRKRHLESKREIQRERKIYQDCGREKELMEGIVSKQEKERKRKFESKIEIDKERKRYRE